MGLLYDRKVKDNKIVIIYKYWPLFYIFLLAFLVLSIVLSFVMPNILTFPLWFIVGIVALIFILGMWKPNKEIRKAMRQGKIEISGSKFSFKKPFTATIKK